MLLTTVVFMVFVLLFNVKLYQMKYEEIERRSYETYNNASNLLESIHSNLSFTLFNRLETLSKLKVFSNVYTDLIDKETQYLDHNLKVLQERFSYINQQFPELVTLQIIDKNGYPYLSLKKGLAQEARDISNRPSLHELLNNPKKRSFYERSCCGTLYRVSIPLIYEGEFVGILEAGISPKEFAKRIHTLLGLQTYLFKKNSFDRNFTSSDHLPASLQEHLLDTTKEKFSYEEKTYIKHELPLNGFEGDELLKIFTLEDITALEEGFTKFMFLSIVITTLLVFSLLAIMDRLFIKILQKIDELLYMLNRTDHFIFAVNALNHKITFANTPLYRTLGLSNKQVKTKDVNSFIYKKDPSTGVNQTLFLQKSIKTQDAFLYLDENKEIPLDLRINYIDAHGGYYIVVAKDITEVLEQNLEREVNEKMINKYIPLSQTDLKGKITYVNEAFCKLTEYTKEELIGKSHRLIRSAKTPSSFYEKLWKTIQENRSFSGELRICTKFQQERWVRIVIEARYNIAGEKIGYVSTREDVTDKQEMRFISEHDQLTKLYNRRSFESKLAQFFEKMLHEQKRFAAIMFDIDHFKKVNDTYGHQVGDTTLQKVAAAISTVVREEDFFARWGGEEFMILINTNKTEDLIRITQKIQKVMQETDFMPVQEVTLSFGLHICSEDESQKDFLTRLDMALYKAKDHGRNRFEIV